MLDCGWVRTGTDFEKHDTAVQWWYYRKDEDGWGFARGGTCRTTRDARHLVQDCHHTALAARRDYDSRSEYKMLEDGSLVEIDRGPYDIKTMRQHMQEAADRRLG